MVSLANRIFGENGTPAFDHKAAADAFVAHFDEFVTRCIEHAAKVGNDDALKSFTAAVNTMESRMKAIEELVNTWKTDETNG